MVVIEHIPAPCPILMLRDQDVEVSASLDSGSPSSSSRRVHRILVGAAAMTDEMCRALFASLPWDQPMTSPNPCVRAMSLR